MDLKQYKTDCLRTESPTDSVVVNELLLGSTLQQIKSLGRILDQIKKHVFYGKEYNSGAMAQDIELAAEGMKTMQTLTHDEIENKEYDVGIDPRVFHAVVGVATESVELLEALRFHHTPMDLVNMREEGGDICWYLSILLDAAGGDWDTVLTNNIDKLRARYPEKFTSEDAINRNLDAERTILENGASQ